MISTSEDYSQLHGRRITAKVERYNPRPETPCSDCSHPWLYHSQVDLWCTSTACSCAEYQIDRSALAPVVRHRVTWLTPDDQEITDPGAIAELERRLAATGGATDG